MASFAKRLGRLALMVPQHDQCLVITFISNLILRHPTIRVMIDRPTTTTDSSSKDIYLSTENDPSKTNALESSLWEIEVNQWRRFLLFSDRFFIVIDSSSPSRCGYMCIGIDLLTKDGK